MGSVVSYFKSAPIDPYLKLYRGVCSSGDSPLLLTEVEIILCRLCILYRRANINGEDNIEWIRWIDYQLIEETEYHASFKVVLDSNRAPLTLMFVKKYLDRAPDESQITFLKPDSVGLVMSAGTLADWPFPHTFGKAKGKLSDLIVPEVLEKLPRLRGST